MVIHFLLLAAGSDQTITLNVFQSVLAIAATFAVWAGAFWRMAKVNQKKESDIYAAIETNKTDINRVGERVNTTNADCSKHEEAITTLRLEQQASRDDRQTMREKIGGNVAAIAAIREELAEERMSVMVTLHNNEKAAAERDAQTREQLARISERLDIERMVTSVVRAMAPNNGNH